MLASIFLRVLACLQLLYIPEHCSPALHGSRSVLQLTLKYVDIAGYDLRQKHTLRTTELHAKQWQTLFRWRHLRFCTNQSVNQPTSARPTPACRVAIRAVRRRRRAAADILLTPPPPTECRRRAGAVFVTCSRHVVYQLYVARFL